MKHLLVTYERVLVLLLGLVMISCQEQSVILKDSSCRYASFFDIGLDSQGLPQVITVSPYDSSRDTITVRKPFSRIVCMSSTHVACLEAIGCDSVVVGVSGVGYLTNEKVKAVAKEIGYDPSIDYETVLSLKPDLFVAYSVSEAQPQYVRKLRSLGVPVLLVSDHLEDHPLARAEYVRLFGCLTGKFEKSYEYFETIESKYNEIASRIAQSQAQKKKVLINLPYSGEWFVPGEENYTCRLVSDAGGRVLGAVEGRSSSSVISMEQALVLSSEADIWLHPGSAMTKKDILHSNPVLGQFPVERMSIYNNTLRSNSEGGNDFWESGAVHPERILSDLATIMHPEVFRADSLEYYVEVK